jgi:TonB family protein
MRPLFLILFTSVITCSFAQQKQTTTFYLADPSRYVSTPDSAEFTRVVESPAPDSNFYTVTEFYKNGKKKLAVRSAYSDGAYFVGECTTWYKNGNVERNVTYRQGQPSGDEYDFYPNGKPYRVITWPRHIDIFDNGSDKFLIKSCNDSLGTALVEDGRGHYRSYDSTYTYIAEEGPVKKGKRDSTWIGEVKSNKISFVEHYDKGNLTNGTATFADGTKGSYTGRRMAGPQFKGGEDALMAYLQLHLKYPADARDNRKEGTVFLSFSVEQSGKISNVRLTKHVYPSIDREALKFLNNSPNWIPATYFGRFSLVNYTMPLNFTLELPN